MKKMFVRDKCRLYVWFWSIVLLERFWSSFAGEGNKSFKAGCCPNCTAVSSLGLSVLYATTASGHCQCFMRPLHQVTVSALCDHCIRSLSVLYATTASGHCQCFMWPLYWGGGTRKKQRNQNQQQNILMAWSSKREWENKNKYNGGQAFVCVCVWFLPVSNDIMLILSPANFLMLYCCTLLNLWQDCGQRGVCCDTKVLCDTRVLCLR